jgi:WD40 repeat protein
MIRLAQAIRAWRNAACAREWLVWLCVLAICGASTACVWLDHRTSTALEHELVEASKHGLALARFLATGSSSVELRFFDGRTEILPISCCPPAPGRNIARNRIVMLDMTNAPHLNPLADPDFLGTLQKYGGNVVAIDTRGKVVARSELWIRPCLVSLSPDGTLFAFVGVPSGHPAEDEGIYIAKFKGMNARRLMSLTSSTLPDDEDKTMRTTLDWSPDGQRLLFSCNRAVLLVDVQTGQSRKLMEGGLAQWSPLGEWISYVTPKSEPVVRNLKSGETRFIDKGHQTLSPMEWSPDGRYLRSARVRAHTSCMGAFGSIGSRMARSSRSRTMAWPGRLHIGCS